VLPLVAERAESAGISTLSYRSTVAALVLLGEAENPALGETGIAAAVPALEVLLRDRSDWLADAADILDTGREIHVLGDWARQGTVEQAALMLREAPRIEAFAWDTGDWLHVGLYTLFTGDAVLLFTGSPADGEAIAVVHARGGRVVAVGDDHPDTDLHVPVNQPIRLVMTSTDVLHAFYAPAMRVKQDIIPRRYTYAWFLATKPGTYRLTCAEYCGQDHSQMGISEEGRRAVVVVHEPTKYEQYLADEYARANQLPPAQLGQKVFEKNCTSCHTTDGTIKVGPSFQHDFGTMVKMADGQTVKMDETYIRESVLSPTAKTRAGFPAGTMPSFEGQLKEKEIEGIIAFIKSLK